MNRADMAKMNALLNRGITRLRKRQAALQPDVKSPRQKQVAASCRQAVETRRKRKVEEQYNDPRQLALPF